MAPDFHNPEALAALAQLADEIMLLAGLASAFSQSCSEHDSSGQEMGIAHTQVQQLSPVVVATLKKCWPAIVHAAVHLSTDEVSGNKTRTFYRLIFPFLPSCIFTAACVFCSEISFYRVDAFICCE